MKPRISILLTAVALLTGGYCYAQNTNTNVNQNTTVIHNFPITERVVEKPVYIEKYRTVYVDRPQPARVAKKLTAPLVLHGYLYVYTEDIGNFKSQRDALEIIGNINRQAPFGRNDWRIPTSAELSVMEQNAAAVGLGDDIYIATDHANGVLRMVSTGATVEEQKEQRYNEIITTILSLESVVINGVVWATRNVGRTGTFVERPYMIGNYYSFQEAQTACPSGWRLPSVAECESLISIPHRMGPLRGVSGHLFVVSNDQALFFPAGGIETTKPEFVGSSGWYHTLNGGAMYMTTDNVRMWDDNSVFDINVRCVRQ